MSQMSKRALRKDAWVPRDEDDDDCPSFPSSSFLKYHDYYIGRRMRIRFDQRAQIDAPLHVIAAAAVRLHLSRGYPLAHEQPPSPRGYMRISLSPAQRQCAAIGFAAAASHGLATAPAGVDVSARTTWHWRTRLLLRIMSVRIARIQVRSRWLRVVRLTQCSFRCRCFCGYKRALQQTLAECRVLCPVYPFIDGRVRRPLNPFTPAARCSWPPLHLLLTAPVGAGCCRRPHRRQARHY